MYFFTADEHYGHQNIIQYCSRPFANAQDMDNRLIANHNARVGCEDIVIHAGDFSLCKTYEEVNKHYVTRLNGQHIFLQGSHDYWLKGKHVHEIYELNIGSTHIVLCHYAMRTWARSHYNSWHLFGHSHGKLEPIGKQWDIGVDNNDFYPLSFDELSKIMETRPDNPNLVTKIRGARIGPDAEKAIKSYVKSLPTTAKSMPDPNVFRRKR